MKKTNPRIWHSYGTFIDAQGEFNRQLYFLSKAVSREETRPQMQVILIEPSDKEEGKFKGVSTDGRRLHMVDPLSCPDGIGLEAGRWKVIRYDPTINWIAKVLEKEDPIMRFPNYRRVIPGDTPTFRTSFTGISFEAAKRNRNLSSLVNFIRAFPDPTVINLDYLADLGASEMVWDVAWRENSRCVVFTNGNCTAVIMPMIWEKT